MTTAAKLVAGLMLLVVLAPVVVGLVNELLVPFVVVVAVLVVARVVWFYTGL